MSEQAPLLTCVGSAEAVARAPRGKYATGRTWLSFFAPSGRFSGTVVWGAPDAADVEAWAKYADVRLSSALEPHATIFDASRVDHLGPFVFGALALYATKRLPRFKRHITRMAIVHGTGIAGAVSAGFVRVVPIPCPVELFVEAPPALDWLDRTDEATVFDEVGALVASHQLDAPILRRLATFLQASPRAAPTDAARALSLSTRSLQRRLSELGTSFRYELGKSRVELAQRLLVDPRASVTEVALAVGLTSPQHLSTLFKKHGHPTPTEWRARMGEGR